MLIAYILLLFCFKLTYSVPDWDILDSRSTPSWYNDAKFGIMVHWGLPSVPAFGTDWFWFRWQSQKQTRYVEYMKKYFPNVQNYTQFASLFNGTHFDSRQWADLFQASGARYVIFTVKDKDGYALFASNYSNGWNTMETGPRRDIFGEIVDSIRTQTTMKVGLYYALLEWFHPLYVKDKAANYTRNEFVTGKIIPELKQLVVNYKPDIVWADAYGFGSDDYWETRPFLSWLYNQSDRVVVNDRWGKNILCKHGDFYTCQDNFNPKILQKHKFENVISVDKYSWSFRLSFNGSQYYSVQHLIVQLVQTVSCGGNFLLNIAANRLGSIDYRFQERLLKIGLWLNLNGEAIYRTIPWTTQKDSISETVWYTQRPRLSSVYAIMLRWPKNNTLVLENNPVLFKPGITHIFLLNRIYIPLMWAQTSNRIYIILPAKQLRLYSFAWTLKITDVTCQEKDGCVGQKVV